MKFTQHIDSKRPDKILKAIMKGIDFGADKIKERAQYFVPVDTGRLQKSIKIKKIEDGKSIGPSASLSPHYAPDVEYGTKFMDAQPYMRPALLESRKKISQFTAKEIRKVLK